LMHSSLSFAARSYSPSGYNCKKQQSIAGIARNNFPMISTSAQARLPGGRIGMGELAPFVTAH
ncbi:MAG: hypothetical protein WBQ87_16315, partial [Candidatus Sulfotelmatobacter sp.]